MLFEEELLIGEFDFWTECLRYILSSEEISGKYHN